MRLDQSQVSTPGQLGESSQAASQLGTAMDKARSTRAPQPLSTSVNLESIVDAASRAASQGARESQDVRSAIGGKMRGLKLKFKLPGFGKLPGKFPRPPRPGIDRLPNPFKPHKFPNPFKRPF